MSRILALIPARGGSKGLPGKHLLELGGVSLIGWTIKAALASGVGARVVVSTDCPDIAEEAKSQGAEVPFMRPDCLATDEATSVDVALHALDELGDYDQLLLLQATSPFREAADIVGAVEAKRAAPAIITVVEATDHPYLCYRSMAGVLEPYFDTRGLSLRRQDLPKAYMPNGALYLVDVPVLRQTKSFMPPGCTFYEMPQDRSVDIDTQEDFWTAEYLLEERA